MICKEKGDSRGMRAWNQDLQGLVVSINSRDYELSRGRGVWKVERRIFQADSPLGHNSFVEPTVLSPLSWTLSHCFCYLTVAHDSLNFLRTGTLSYLLYVINWLRVGY